MYGNRSELPYGYSADHHLLPFSGVTAASSILPTTPLAIPTNDYYGSSVLALKPELSYCSSACSSHGSPSSLTSYAAENAGFLQRSTSTLSLQKSVDVLSPLVSSPTAAYTADESDSSSVRKAFSTGDLQGINLVPRNQRSESPLSNEASIIESMNKACRYSPEEKRERIERYRSKRNLRNFNKKIKYECRKTLADSRPRIRGRFARNDEIEKTPENQWGNTTVGAYEDEDDNNWLSFLDSYSSANFIPCLNP